MGYMKYITSSIFHPNTIICTSATLIGFYLGKLCDDAETQRMTRYRDRSALYGRPPPPPGVTEIPSW